MQKRTFTLIELIVYIFIAGFVGVNVIVVIFYFISLLNKNTQVSVFSQSYDNIVKYAYSYNYDGRHLTGVNSTGLVLYNNGDTVDYSGYIGYLCTGNQFSITNISSGMNQIKWDSYKKVFTGADCSNLTGRMTTGGYWMKFNMNLLDNSFDTKYYFNSSPF